MQNNNLENKKSKKVVVGMSGGVDSSVATFLLKKNGYEVIGLHMQDADELSEKEDSVLVKQICEKLGVKFEIVNYSNEMQKVKDYFVHEYAIGRTPNPCVICNKEVKFNPFIEYAKKIGADYFATGHYAKIEHENGKHILKKGKCLEKDQSYFLNQLSQSQLEMALFPLGDLTKDEVRKIAEENGLASAHKKDSFDVCFIGSQKFKDYMAKNYPEREGNIINILNNKIIGKHLGISKYTIGQRKGLGIGGGFGETGEGWFVVKKDFKNNALYVAQGSDDSLYSDSLISNNFNWISKFDDKSVFRCNAKFRYRQQDQPVKVIINSDKSVLVEFENPQRAITLGQYVVLYDNDVCLGGGTIDKVLKNGNILDI